MGIVKEYIENKTKIRIHDDFVGTEDEKRIKEIVMSLVINKIKKNNGWNWKPRFHNVTIRLSW